MKFKLSIILFNVLMLSAFGMILAMPALTLGAEFARDIWARLWVFPLILFVLVAGFDFFFLFNRRFYGLLEQEKWADLLDYLEEEFYQRSGGRWGLRLNRFRIKIFISAAFLSGQSRRLKGLEDFLREKQPELLDHFFLSFGLTRLLENDPPLLEDYYGGVFSREKVENRGWCIWLYSFALLMQKKVSPARENLRGLLAEKDPLLRLLTLYLLSTAEELVPAGAGEPSGGGRFQDTPLFIDHAARLRRELPPRRFQNLKRKDQDNLLLFTLSSFIDQAYEWLEKK